jgi:hypothetical protein
MRWDLVDEPLATLTLPPTVFQNLTGGGRAGSGPGYYNHHQQELLLRELLDEPATLPPTTTVMTITCPHLLWAVKVYPSGSSPPSSPDSPGYSPTSSIDSAFSSSSYSSTASTYALSHPRSHPHSQGGSSGARYVTVRDVLTEIYYTLRSPISQLEYAQLPCERDRERAARAYKRRYRRVLPAHEDAEDSRREREYEEEKKGGLRRVDFLMEKTRFGGLSRGRSLMPGEWVLDVE